MNLLITGGAGFIGSHVVEFFAKKYPQYKIIVMDCITYAADENFFEELPNRYSNVTIVREDITNRKICDWMFTEFKIDGVIHLAAESHVDNSIIYPLDFVQTNIIGTLNLLNAARKKWAKSTNRNLFYHISTDEVYGHLDLDDPTFTEETPYDPRSPYSASKAASDHFVRAFYNTYKLPIVISNSSNNYGERQHKEKLLPKSLLNILSGKKIPIHGTGENIRDWLYVKDHVDAIDMIFHRGRIGETYNVGGDMEMINMDIVNKLIDIHIKKDNNNPSTNYDDYIELVRDRKGHDFRYGVNHDKITKELGWEPQTSLQDGLVTTYMHYREKLNKIKI